MFDYRIFACFFRRQHIIIGRHSYARGLGNLCRGLGNDIQAVTAMRELHRRAICFTVIDVQTDNLAKYEAQIFEAAILTYSK